MGHQIHREIQNVRTEYILIRNSMIVGYHISLDEYKKMIQSHNTCYKNIGNILSTQNYKLISHQLLMYATELKQNFKNLDQYLEKRLTKTDWFTYSSIKMRSKLIKIHNSL